MLAMGRNLHIGSGQTAEREASKPGPGRCLGGVRETLKLPADFVIHSLRHTMLTRLGEAGVDAFTIMRIAGHSSITVSRRYVHPSPESVEHAFARLEASNQAPPTPIAEQRVRRKRPK